MRVCITQRFAGKYLATPRPSELAILLCVALSNNGLGQDLDKAGWLPKTLAESYSQSLLLASNHILTREGCDLLLEAKISENSQPDNPKFILTCADKHQVTANFVYWQSDVNSGFANDSYPEKRLDLDSIETLSEHEAKLKLRSENTDLIAACTAELIDLLDDRPLLLKASGIDVSQRGTQPVVVSLDYQVGDSSYAPKFSAICRRDSFDAINLRIFSKQ